MRSQVQASLLGAVVALEAASETATGPLLPDGRSRMSTAYIGPPASGAVSAAT